MTYSDGTIGVECIVNTENGPQRAIKVTDLNGGGGGGGTVDQTYDATSTNAQSGTAVASAISGKQDTLTTAQQDAVDSGITSALVTQIGTNTQAISDEATARGNADIELQNEIDGILPSQTGQSGKYLTTDGTSVSWGEVQSGGLQNVSTAITSLAIEGNSAVTASGDRTVLLGYSAGRGSQNSGNVSAVDAVSIGYQSSVNECSIAIGRRATAMNRAIAIGTADKSEYTRGAYAYGHHSIAIGTGYGVYGTDVEFPAMAEGIGAIAIGTACRASQTNSIQLGRGNNETANTFQVYTFPMLDGNTGYIPADRLGTGFDATKTQVLKNVNGTLTWVDE